MATRLSPAVVVTLLVGALSGAGIALTSRIGAAGPPEPRPGLAQVEQLSSVFQEIGRELAPSVISVSAYRRSGTRERRTARGSGVILHEDGLAITNYHVVEGADIVRVRLEENREVEAVIRGVDAEGDLAVLDLEGGGFSAATLSSEAPPEVGSWVLAFGNPLGLGLTMTFGVVSGKGRALDIAVYEDFIQTDAAINAGNSGGPLIDVRGQVVGINTAKGTRFDGNLGLGFAIPAYMVRKAFDDILENGHISRGWLGIRFSEYRAETSGDEKLRSYVAVDSVLEGGPAEDAGLEVGDVVLAVDGQAVTKSQEFLRAIARLEPGSEARLELQRDGVRKELPVRVGERQVDSR